MIYLQRNKYLVLSRVFLSEFFRSIFWIFQFSVYLSYTPTANALLTGLEQHRTKLIKKLNLSSLQSPLKKMAVPVRCSFVLGDFLKNQHDRDSVQHIWKNIFISIKISSEMIQYVTILWFWCQEKSDLKSIKLQQNYWSDFYDLDHIFANSNAIWLFLQENRDHQLYLQLTTNTCETWGLVELVDEPFCSPFCRLPVYISQWNLTLLILSLIRFSSWSGVDA